MDPADELAALCYGGETLLEVAVVEGGAIGVTSHRLLALTPDGSGARFRAVDRPNVTGLTAGTDGPTGLRDRSAKAGVVAVALLFGAAVIDLGGLVEPPTATGGGLGGLFGLLDLFVTALGLVDEALAIGGLVALAVALGSLGWYLRERDRVIEVGVAGDDPVRVPIARGEADVAGGLDTALESATPGSD